MVHCPFTHKDERAVWLYRTASHMRRRGTHYNRRGARHYGALLIHVECNRMFTAVSTPAHSIASAAHCLKPLRVHVPPELLRCRRRRSPERETYRQCKTGVWRGYSWREVEGLVARRQLALAGENLASGDRVAVLLKNGMEWVCFNLAAQSMGPAVVPLYTADHEDNTSYILADSGTRLLPAGHIDRWIAKEIVVLFSGEKVTPEHVEMALILDPLIGQAMVVGEGRPYLAALLVLNAGAWRALAKEWSLPADDPAALTDVRLRHHIEQICHRSPARFPDYAQVRRVWLTLEPWTIDDDRITPTFKLKRPAIEKRFAKHILGLYTGHMPPP